MRRYLSYVLLLLSFHISAIHCQELQPVHNQERSLPTLPQEPTKVEEIHTSTLWIRMILLLTLIVGFLFLASWGLKKLQTMRFMQPGKESLIQLVDRRALSPKSCIWIVDIDNVRIAVGESHQQGIQLLHTWEKE